jgi:dCMP deaminase
MKSFTSLLDEWEKHHKYRERPDWTDYYLAIASVVSQRSHDAETQHGCVITNQDHRVLGIGYNGFPRGVPQIVEQSLPNTRPFKYPWMIHAEHNAAINCTHTPTDGVAYTTGSPCNPCISTLWQHGVVVVYTTNVHAFVGNNDKETEEIRLGLLKSTGMQLIEVPMDELPLTKMIRQTLQL